MRFMTICSRHTMWQQSNRDAAEMPLDDLEIKWGEGYPIVIKNWRDNWERLTAYF